MIPTSLYTDIGFIPAVLNQSGVVVRIDWSKPYQAQDLAIEAARNLMETEI